MNPSEVWWEKEWWLDESIARKLTCSRKDVETAMHEIMQIFDTKFLRKARTRDGHFLVRWLRMPSIYAACLLIRLGTELSRLKECPGFDKVVKGLKRLESDQQWHDLLLLETAGGLAQQGLEIEFEPRIHGFARSPDMSATTSIDRFFVEVKYPQRSDRWRLFDDLNDSIWEVARAKHISVSIQFDDHLFDRYRQLTDLEGLASNILRMISESPKGVERDFDFGKLVIAPSGPPLSVRGPKFSQVDELIRILRNAFSDACRKWPRTEVGIIVMGNPRSISQKIMKLAFEHIFKELVLDHIAAVVILSGVFDREPEEATVVRNLSAKIQPNISYESIFLNEPRKDATPASHG